MSDSLHFAFVGGFVVAPKVGNGFTFLSFPMTAWGGAFLLVVTSCLSFGGVCEWSYCRKIRNTGSALHMVTKPAFPKRAHTIWSSSHQHQRHSERGHDPPTSALCCLFTTCVVRTVVKPQQRSSIYSQQGFLICKDASHVLCLVSHAIQRISPELYQSLSEGYIVIETWQ